MNLFTKNLFLLFFICCASVASSQVKFYATISPAVIGTNDFTTLRFTLENAKEFGDLTAPSLKNFNLIGGPASESGMTNINGVVTRYIAISFTLRPKKSGKFTISGASIVADGKRYTSDPVSILVRNSPVSPSPLPNGLDPLSDRSASFNDNIFREGESVPDKVNRNMHLRVEANKKSCYVGEPVVASYKLYTRLKSESRLTQNPAFNGFSVIDLQAPDVTGFEKAELNGKEYNVYTIRKAQLYPLQPGVIALEKAELENKIQFIKESYADRHIYGFEDIFDDFANATVPDEGIIEELVTLTSQPLSITVKPLPEAGKPSSFKGAVGKFNLSAALDNGDIATDKPGRLIVTVSGAGNLQLVTAPDIKWPEGIEPFQPIVFDNLNRTGVPVTGNKVFEFPFSVEKAGKFSLPPVEFSFFDPESEKYRTVVTGVLSFEAVQGKNPPVADVVLPKARERKTFMDEVLTSKWLVPGLGAGVLLAGLMFFISRKRRNENAPEMVEVPGNTFRNDRIEIKQNPLEDTERCLRNEDCSEFYIILNRELKEFLACKLKCCTKDITRKQVLERLDYENLPNHVVLQLDSLMQDVEWQLYTPFERNAKMEKLYQRTQEAIQTINTYSFNCR